MKIYLIGYMGCGKTTIGKKLADYLNFEFFDTDIMIEEKYCITTNKIFEIFGEAKFRELEEKILLMTKDIDNAVISTGGGTPCYKDNMKFILQNGFSIYFKMDVETLFKRLVNAKKRRPLIKDLEGEDLRKYIQETLVEREKYYNLANCVVNGENLNVEKLINYLQPFIKDHGSFIENKLNGEKEF